MTVEQLINSIINLQSDNPDKVGTFFSLYGEMPRSIFSKNNLFLYNESVPYSFEPITSLSLIDENNVRSGLPLNSSINLLYASNLESSILSTSSVAFYTNNLLPTGIDIANRSSILTNLYEKMKLEAGALTDYISLQNDYIVLPFDKTKINELISCSLGDTTDETILSQGRLQFAKEAVKVLNKYIEDNNLFYYYIPKDIELNYSDDDGYDSSYGQLKTQNVYNYFDQNYEAESILVDEKLLPSVLHQTFLYASSRLSITGRYYSSLYSPHFSVKQIFGNELTFSNNIYTTPNIDYSYYPNVDNTNSQFISSLYTNWKASKYISGSYTHYNGYQPVNNTRTEQNNSNLFVDITNFGTTLYNPTIQGLLDTNIPYYSKVSFGVPQQETNFIVSGTTSTAWNPIDDKVSKTIFMSLVNNLYVDGRVIDENNLLLNSQYTTSSVNINLLKFFNEYYNVSDTIEASCSEEINMNFEKIKVGKDTNTIDNIFGFLSNYNLLPNLISTPPKNEQQDYMAQFTNIEADGSDANFGDHLLQLNKTYEKFLCSRLNTENKYYFLTKIAKYRVEEDGSETFVQNFYFDLRKTTLGFPTDDLVYEFFDNQIYAATRYNYKITQLIIVPAFSYGYTGVDVVEQNGRLGLLLGVSGVPIYKLIEVPITSESDIVVMEKPPTTPRVQFYPILNNKKEIIIQISPFGFEKTEEPIIIEDSDAAIFDKALESQNSTGSLLFTKDYDESGVESYEIFRTTVYPNSYSYFSSFKIATINNISDTVNNYYNTVEPNINYYYCVRSKNFRGLPSNPTKVYRVKLVEDGEFYTLEQEIIENINSEDIYKRQAVKDIKRFLYITPSETQKLISGSIEGNATDSIVDFPLSSASEEVWGKKFKIRITSKSSGKSVDFNIKFNKNNSGEFIPE